MIKDKDIYAGLVAYAQFNDKKLRVAAGNIHDIYARLLQKTNKKDYDKLLQKVRVIYNELTKKPTRKEFNCLDDKVNTLTQRIFNKPSCEEVGKLRRQLDFAKRKLVRCAGDIRRINLKLQLS